MKTACLAKSPGSEPGRTRAARHRPFFSAAQRKADEPLQAKMRVGAAGDRFEVEADRTADRVINGQDTGLLAHGVSRIVQRAPSEVEEPEVQARGAPDQEEEVQAKGAPNVEEEVRARDASEKEEDVQAKAGPDEEEEVQASAADEEEKVQARAEAEEEAQAKAEDEDPQAKEEAPGPHGTESKEEELQAKAGEEEPEVQRAGNRKEDELQPRTVEKEELGASARDEDEVQARGGVAAPRVVPDGLSRQIRASRGLGNPLPEAMRDRMGKAFGADISGVRIHTDAAAVLLARSLGAQAFTVGSDIYFGEGKFSPGSRDGQHLLAHELTHTVQQGAVEPETDGAALVRLAPEAAGEESYDVRPEIVEAIRYARGEIGKVNAKKAGADGKRLGWERLREYFLTAFGGPTVSEAVIDKIVMIEKTAADGSKSRMDALPSWCGIFTWWAMKKAGIPIPDWKLGAPALDAMKLRPPGSLPRKGDIAIDVAPYNHFAMVTGLESARDAEGKPAKMTRVATINGNTAGDDNLGGQVQERWDSLSRWDHFFDPVGKMSLPGVPLVTVSREPGEAEPAKATEVQAVPQAEKEAERSGAAEAAEATDQTVRQLQEDLPPPAGETFGDALPEPDMSLPPRVEVGPAEQVAVVEKVELGGSSDEATTAFIDASPSSMAATQPQFGPAVDARMKGEQQEIADNPPELGARLAGTVGVEPKGPEEIPIPTDTSLAGEAAALGQGDIPGVAMANPAQYRGNADREKELDEEKSGSFWDAFMDFMRGFTKDIRTRDDSVDTSAGERPSVDLSEDANPGEMGKDQKAGTTDLRKQRDAQVASFRNNPGQANIQPRKVDESYAAPVSEEPAATIECEDDEAVRDFAEAPLPADVRARADSKIAEVMTPNLAEARTQTIDAASTRDSDKKKEIATAETEAARISTDADADQRKIVIDNRGKVAALQTEGIGDAYKAVNDFSDEATKRQGADRKEIGEHVAHEQGEAKKCLEKGEKDAREEKEKTEKDAAEKKRKLDEEQKKRSWWDRVKSAIKSAVKAITKLIDDAFNALRKFVKETIEKAKNLAIGLINKARNWVVDKINKFRDWAKEQVNKYLADTFPGLAKRINEGIDAVADTAIEGVNRVADAAIEGINKLANALAAALDKILSTFQVALKTAVRVVGAVMQGDFLEALKAAIEGACEIAGIDPKPVFEFLDRAGKAIRSILKDPVGFIKKLFGAVGDGISAFFKNIKKHLIEGVIGWLTGALSEVNLTGPFEFTPKGILRIVLEILGLTYANIKARVIKKLPAAAKVFDVVEKGFTLVKRLITEGPSALWEEIKERISSLKETVMGAIKSWLITTVIKEGIVWLLSLTNPASAIVKAIKLLYDLVMFLVERYQQIKDFILTVYDAVSAIAAGNFTKVVTAVENALARMVPVLISLLASLIGLGGIAKQVKKVIETITKPINKAIDWVVDKIVAFARKIVGKVKAVAKKAKEKGKEAIEKIVNWWKERRRFKSKDGASHSIYYAGEGKNAELMVASTAMPAETFLKGKTKDTKAPASERQVASEALAQYKVVLASEKQVEKLRLARESIPTSDKERYRAATSAVNSEIANFRNQLDALSTILQKVTFDTQNDELVQTNVTHGCGGDKSTMALPLTFLSGNTKGSRPSQDPPGWKHAVALDTKPDGSSLHMWVRGHLLNDNLHGPGTADNLVPITQGMNRKMEAQAESPAKSAIQAKGKFYFFKAEATFWKKPAPIDAFPERIVVKWGEAERDATNKTNFKEKTAKAPVVIEMGTPPPAVAAAFVPSINGGSPLLLFNAISKHGTVTSYFVSQVLLRESSQSAFNSRDNMKARLWASVAASLRAKEGETVANNRQAHVNATYKAIGAGDVAV